MMEIALGCYLPARAHLAPQDTMPQSSHLPVALFIQLRGPPLSPWQLSLLVSPAQSIVSVTTRDRLA